MRFMTLKNGVLPRRAAFMAASAALIGLGLAGCADDAATGTPFTQALAKDYTDLSTQAAALPVPPDQDSGFFGSLFGSDNPNDALVKGFDDKAETANAGEEPVPEPPPPDAAGQDIRDRLIRDIAAGKDQFPSQAAAAQGDYDCWILASAIPSAAAMAQACRTALASDLITLENGAHPAPLPMPAQPMPAPPPPPPPAPAASATDFTVYFDFDSWTLTAEDLKVITDVINSARSGGQTHIAIVGHTDTSGSAEYNQRLSVHRANVVVEALVDLGARRAAIKASGVGENDLAVQTADGVKEAKNRRSVIDLKP
jgi:outer membrane protein OmpA-like peptidoglycan-associated protein